MNIDFRLLGQSGCRIECVGLVIYMDPYLSHSVQELDAPDLERKRPIPILPGDVTDADWMLVTHEHIDHCDPHTLPIIASASERCRFMGPHPVLKRLTEWNIPSGRCLQASEQWMSINEDLRIRAVPAAHPNIERDESGALAYVGYLLEIADKKIYLAGDTSVTDELLETLKLEGPFSAAVLPVNERNYFRDRRGIIGNMSIREAFLLAEEIGTEMVIPVHWDMFDINSVEPAEIEAVYNRLRPSFTLNFNPTSIAL
jgi:L-ascorbate metabolism protein UlaG (beta-lactamase superfamily)